ncbi:MAG: GxxExxY protein [Saprospiraceae bacterium]
MQKGDLTYRINGCAMEVHNHAHRGHMEYIYCRALAIELNMAGIKYEREVWLPIHYKKWRIGHRRCDFLVENKVVIEVKAVGKLENEHISQAIDTVEAWNYADGLLLNFGGPKLEYKHIFNNKVKPESEFEDAPPDLVGELADDLFSSRRYMPAWLVEKMQHDRVKKKVK